MSEKANSALDDIFGSQPAAPVQIAEPAKQGVAARRIAEVKEILTHSAAPALAPAQMSNPAQVKYHSGVIQGSDEWLAMRRGILTASEMKLIITPSLKVTDNDKTRAHVYEIAAQRITEYVEPHYVSDDMLRGQEDEIDARLLYITNYAPVQEVGFITNDSFGFTIGYSPDGLVGDDGLIECKSRRQKYQLQTLVEHVSNDSIPDDYMIQIQTGLLVSGRAWCDFITYCGGMEMAVVRVSPDEKIQAAIVEAATEFEVRVQAVIEKYQAVKESKARLLPTERRVEQEITLGYGD